MTVRVCVHCWKEARRASARCRGCGSPSESCIVEMRVDSPVCYRAPLDNPPTPPKEV
jgi:predicted amidophosphoribosyltransferase